MKATQKQLGRDPMTLGTAQTVGRKLADGNVIQGKVAGAAANCVWLDVDKKLWVALAGTKGQVQHPFEINTETLRCFVAFSSMPWLMIT